MLTDEEIARLKEIFVTREECIETTDGFKKRFGEFDVAFALIEQRLNTISWTAKTTLGAVLTGIVGALMALILR